MKTIYIVYTELGGENDLVFDHTFKCLDMWSCNDATWRNEYFAPFMRSLGINVLEEFPPDKMSSKNRIIKEALEARGISTDE